VEKKAGGLDGEQVNLFANKREDNTVPTPLANEIRIFAVRHYWPGMTRGLSMLLICSRDGFECLWFHKAISSVLFFTTSLGRNGITAHGGKPNSPSV